MNQNTTPVVAGSQHVDPNVLDWQEIKNLGLEPAPVGLAADDDQPLQN